MKIWKKLPILSAPMPFQMALDEIVFRQMLNGKKMVPVVRFYFSSEPWLTVGYSHPKNSEIERAEIPVCRRITGGGVVQHGKDLLVSLVAKKEDDESFSSVRVSYWKIHEALKKAFEAAGEKPRFYRCDEKLPRGGECFVYPIATDLALDEKKVAGGAQKRSSGVLLHQESVQLPPRMDAFAFAESVQKALENEFQVSIEDEAADPDLFAQAKRLAQEKYAAVSQEPALHA
jgi:lipoate-protein ligase A